MCSMHWMVRSVGCLSSHACVGRRWLHLVSQPSPCGVCAFFLFSFVLGLYPSDGLVVDRSPFSFHVLQFRTGTTHLPFIPSIHLIHSTIHPRWCTRMAEVGNGWLRLHSSPFVRCRMCVFYLGLLRRWWWWWWWWEVPLSQGSDGGFMELDRRHVRCDPSFSSLPVPPWDRIGGAKKKKEKKKKRERETERDPGWGSDPTQLRVEWNPPYGFVGSHPSEGRRIKKKQKITKGGGGVWGAASGKENSSVGSGG